MTFYSILTYSFLNNAETSVTYRNCPECLWTSAATFGGKKIVWCPAEFVSLLTHKETVGLSFYLLLWKQDYLLIIIESRIKEKKILTITL